MSKKSEGDRRNKISLKEFEVLNTGSCNVAGSEGGVAQIFNPKEFCKKLRTVVISLNSLDIEFDLVGYDPAMVNALRRILLSDVPTMAIEKVHMYQNTSIMQDEVLAHRLGLLPLTADPRLFNYPSKDWSPESGTEQDTLEFSLAVRCRAGADNTLVTTGQLEWRPRGDQADWLTQPGPAQQDILINKLRPGHEMEINMFAVKGLGRDHAKFSPVSTAFYRLMPLISLVPGKAVAGEKARRLQKCFSPGVIGLEANPAGGEPRAVVEQPRLDSCSRNVFRYPDLAECVELGKQKDHFIFSVESVGASRPEDLVCMAWDVLIEKCDHFIGELEKTGTKNY